MQTLNRRDFLKVGGAALAGLLTSRVSGVRAAPPFQAPLPASLGRSMLWRQAVRTEPVPGADVAAWKYRDEVFPLHAAVVGEPPWPTNSIWYQVEGGYIHSGYVQPVENLPQPAITHVPEAGFWTEVSVPFAEARWRPGSQYVARKLYYQTVYRVVDAVPDEEGVWWYQLNEGITWSPGPYVLASSLRYIPPEELAPIAPGQPDKWIYINTTEQRVDCMVGDQVVFTTPAATGTYSTATPWGEFTMILKRHTSRMMGEDYDLPGVAFPTYFTWSGVAIHGTFWHNDYGRRHSHGCINVPSSAAKWIFRWVEPQTPYHEWTQRIEPGTGTRVVVEG